MLTLPDSTNVEVTRTTATITMVKHISLSELQMTNGAKSNYTISSTHHSEEAEQIKSWFASYKPLLIIFVFIVGISIIKARMENEIHWMKCMNNFMSSFFFTFSFFKLLNLNAFAESYSTYDVVAKKIKTYGFIYPIIELALGIAFLTLFNPFITNIATLIVMSISIIGVL